MNYVNDASRIFRNINRIKFVIPEYRVDMKNKKITTYANSTTLPVKPLCFQAKIPATC
ncbi:unnamed protein product [Nezara viridula]|uniref:Uncharacterized protein n=1 Tax=Nezara viridula TaxID=85310 RepID=A0A9P0MD53_NEZVI|nr:unnamed protein product [Nezara viridula]